MSVWIANPTPLARARVSSSISTVLNRKSRSPPPPYCSGIMKPSRPAWPAAIHSSRGTMPASSQLSWCGTISLSQNARAVSRKAS